VITPKENYLMALRGEIPEYIPRYTFGPPPKDKVVANVAFTPPILMGDRRPGVRCKDIWGVTYVPADKAGATIPEPNNFILKDITKWRDVIKAPSLEGVDWEKMVKKDLEDSGVDRTQTCVTLGLFFGYFQTLMSFMGFTEGLIAMHEEPEEVMALFQYLSDFYMEVAEHVIDLYDPDIISLVDDTAAQRAPFISPKMYREMLVPYHDRWAKMGRERGKCITMHNCGKCESVVDEFVKMGVSMWEPAQIECNDLDAIQAKYGRKLCLGTAWSGKGKLLNPDITEEEIREEIYAVLNRLAKNGGFMWSVGFIARPGDEASVRKAALFEKVFGEISHSFYKS
jgi:hypothetical protein